MTENQNSISWKQTYALAALFVSIAISWIAYHEYQPKLLEKFGLQELSVFLIVAKGVVLVVVPPLAGWLADRYMERQGKVFMIFSIGIGLTSMIFMAVATIIGSGPLSSISFLLPYLIIVWLIAMNIFNSPALSTIDAFGPEKKLPILAAFLFFTTEIVYSLEPVVVELVNFFGDTLTFVVGGILIAVTGTIFYRVSSSKVSAHRIADPSGPNLSFGVIRMVIVIGLVLGAANSFLVEWFPARYDQLVNAAMLSGNYLSFGLMGFAAILAMTLGRYVSKIGIDRVLRPSIALVLLSLVIMLLANGTVIFVTGAVSLAVGFSMLSVCGLPYVLTRSSTRVTTLAVGIFIGASFIIEGLLEYYMNVGSLS